MTIFVGVDWAEAHHDVCVKIVGGNTDQGPNPRSHRGSAAVPRAGRTLRRRTERCVGEHRDRPRAVRRGIGGCRLPGYAVNPFSASRYRDRHSTSGAKSDPGDAEVLADLVRTDAHHHRQVAGDTDLAEAVKILARAHQSMIWTKGRQTNTLRSTLREFYPAALVAFGDDLDAPAALEILHDRPDTDARSPAVSVEDRSGPPPSGTPTPDRRQHKCDPRRPACRGTRSPDAYRRRLRIERGGDSQGPPRVEPADRRARTRDGRPF